MVPFEAPVGVGRLPDQRDVVAPGYAGGLHLDDVTGDQEASAARACVLDLSALADFEGSRTSTGIGDGVGIREVWHYVFPDSDTWSFTTNRIAADGSFYGYGNYLTRGFDVYRASGAGLSGPPLEPRDLGKARAGSGFGDPGGRPRDTTHGWSRSSADGSVRARARGLIEAIL